MRWDNRKSREDKGEGEEAEKCEDREKMGSVLGGREKGRHGAG